MTQYHLFLNNVDVGPFLSSEIGNLFARKGVTLTTPVRRDGSEEWKPLSDYPELLPPEDAARTATARELAEQPDGTLRFSCPHCGRHYAGPASYLGQSLQCHSCNKPFTVPIPPHKQTAAPGAEEASDEIPEGDLICPHCWKSFERDNLLFISQHPSLLGDPLLGEFEHRRFHPRVYNAKGQPLDAEGVAVSDTACPHCHLRLPGTLVDLPSFYCSIIGAPSSGKSYFLTGMLHQLKRILPESFESTLLDPDPQLNQIINGYERLIFMAIERDKVVMLPKTQQTGSDFSDQILLNGIRTDLPKPFVFEYRPRDAENGMNLVFYDNAGEQFQPGADVLINPATQHLARSNALIFLFDPINDAMMRPICDTSDPQVTESAKVSDQSVLFSEMIHRIRRHRNMEAREVCDIPLVIVLGKYDAWMQAFPKELRKLSPLVRNQETGEAALDRTRLLDISFAAREFMMAHVPELVSAAEAFFREVYFLPSSNFGVPAKRANSGGIGVVPSEINPIWVEVPLLLLLSLYGILPAEERPSRSTDPAFAAKVEEDTIRFRHPSTGKIVHLPLNYLGAELEIGRAKYAMPSRQWTARPRPGFAGSDRDLWK